MQVPAQVEYERATSVAHALDLLVRYGPESRILAGGHSLIPMMKLRLAQPETLIDINGLSELSYVRVADGELQIGALTRHAQLLDSALAGEHCAILHDAERVIADPVVRNWGSVGGSLCQADPSEDLSAAFAALKATMVIQGPGGSRTVSAREFHTGPYLTSRSSACATLVALSYSTCAGTCMRLLLRAPGSGAAGLAAPRLPLAAFSSVTSRPGWLPPRPAQEIAWDRRSLFQRPTTGRSYLPRVMKCMRQLQVRRGAIIAMP